MERIKLQNNDKSDSYGIKKENLQKEESKVWQILAVLNMNK